MSQRSTLNLFPLLFPLLLQLPGCEPVVIGDEDKEQLELQDDENTGVEDHDGSTSMLLVSDQLDVLFVVDNSVQMKGKQELLAEAIPDLLDRITTPVEGKEDAPIKDVHFGIISSSLGGYGSQVCQRDDVEDSGAPYAFDDRAQLLPLVRGTDGPASSKGFLSWTGGTDEKKATLSGQIQEMILDAGERGCGFESPLEAMYRFLVDPQPPFDIVMDGTRSIPMRDPEGKPEVDRELLSQRANFLRPKSSVAIILITDEDDCSAMIGGPVYTNSSFGWLVPEVSRPMLSPSPSCASNPNDECCFSCIQVSSIVDGCEKDVQACAPGGRELSPESDRANVRCFNGKERFGIDLLYPVERYIDGLTQSQIRDARSGELVTNPLLEQRDPRHVFLAGIVGVPWQDIATAETLDDPKRLRFLSPKTLTKEDELLDGKTRWDLILGEPNKAESSLLCDHDLDFGISSARDADPRCGLKPVPPLDPFMIGSIAARTGEASNPITGDKIASVDSEDPFDNAINGHESNHSYTDYQFPDGGAANDELQFSCIYESLQPKVDCSFDDPSCQCGNEPTRNSAVCQPPEGAAAGTTQYFEGAHPPPRILEVLRGVGEQATVASICPKITDTELSQTYYGYRPAMQSLSRNIWSVR